MDTPTAAEQRTIEESAVTGLGGTVRGRYDDDRDVTFEGSFNREVRIRVGGVDVFVSALDLQRVVNAATWCAEVDSWGNDPDPTFLSIHPGQVADYNRALVTASRALLDAVTDVYVSPVPEDAQKAARGRMGLAHQNLERLLAANGDLP